MTKKRPPLGSLFDKQKYVINKHTQVVHPYVMRDLVLRFALHLLKEVVVGLSFF